MDRSRPPLRIYQKPLARLKLPVIPRVKAKSLFEEYYYGFLLAFAAVVIVLLKAGGMSTYDSVVGGLWVGAIAFFVTQIIRYFKFKTNPEAEKKEAGANSQSQAEQKVRSIPAQQTKEKNPPARPIPGVKDTGVIHLVPKEGQAPRPPIITGTAKPSPFIKPPK
jgi:hypothetical protein